MVTLVPPQSPFSHRGQVHKLRILTWDVCVLYSVTPGPRKHSAVHLPTLFSLWVCVLPGVKATPMALELGRLKQEAKAGRWLCKASLGYLVSPE